jgi:hypothetical protein
MKVSCFSFLRDGVHLGYPFVESIRSALPICDEFVIAVGKSRDDTLEQLRGMNEPKLRLIETTWNEKMRSHGFVYGQQKMIAQYNCTGDWAFYLEGDEILHEAELDTIRGAMEKHLDDPAVEVLTFDYYHFYGNPETIKISAQAYRKAARIIRNDVRSIAPDGLYWAVMKGKNFLGRRNKRRNRYPYAAETGAHIYHYGDCRHEKYMANKAETVNQYWKDNLWSPAYGNIDPQSLGPFPGTHPAIILPWLEQHGNHELVLNPDYELTSRDKKHRLTRRLETLLGRDLSKRHFKLIK